jgi:ectoine hydroxylase-related dioxygenase (phytanoyl-CoA dioxygenase family)
MVKIKKHLADLKKYGYCVIPNILTSDESNYYIEEIWLWLEGLGTGIDRTDPTTWRADKWPPATRGIIHDLSVGHADFIWDLRLNPNVLQVFEKLWKTSELLVSFDGINIMKPPKLNGSVNKKSWFHTDQSPQKKGMHCVQGLVNLDDSDATDGAFVVLSGSHHYHEQLFERNGHNDSFDWYKLLPNDMEWLLKQDNVEQKIVPAPKGAMILWDSRTIHCNKSPDPQSENFRYAIYVCMTPASFASEADIKKEKICLRESQNDITLAS